MVNNDNKIINEVDSKYIDKLGNKNLFLIERESKELELLSLKVDIAERLNNLGVPGLNTKYILKMLGIETQKNVEAINFTSTETGTSTATSINFTDSATNFTTATWKHELTFNALRSANLARIPLFKNAKGEQAHSQSDGSDWSLGEWCNAVTGELGEAANIIKKIGRGDFTLEDAREDLAKEFADIVVYLDILAMRAGVNLGDAVVKKFNEVSERVGCNIFLSEQPLINYYLNKPEEVKDEVKNEPKRITKEQAEQCLIEEVLYVIDICKVSTIIVSNEVSEILKKADGFIINTSADLHTNKYTHYLGILNNCKIETPTLFTSQIPMHYIYKYGSKGSWILLHELSI